MITKNQFERYEGVRVSGVTNMFAVTTVCAISGLEKKDCLEIMDKYSELKAKYMESERGRDERA